jgi:hypothetical protein
MILVLHSKMDRSSESSKVKGSKDRVVKDLDARKEEGKRRVSIDRLQESS